MSEGWIQSTCSYCQNKAYCYHTKFNTMICVGCFFHRPIPLRKRNQNEKSE
jgi:hypothetical protein